jgi:single-strand DNA-binding protein
LSKGRPVLIEGRLKYDTWQTDKGEKRSKVNIIAERVVFVGSAPQRGGQEFQEGGPAPARAERPSRPAPEPPMDDMPPEAPAGGKEKDDIPF